MGEGFRFELEEREEYLKGKLYGSATLANLMAVLDAVSKDGIYVHARRLWDLSECSIELSSDDLRSLAVSGKNRDLSKSRVAFVASSDLTFGLARMHEVFREHSGFSSKVFRDEDEAIRWLVA